MGIFTTVHRTFLWKRLDHVSSEVPLRRQTSYRTA